MKKIYHSLPSYVAALILLSFGVIYLFRSSFMPYHSAAAQMSWDEVSPGLRYVIEALMRAAAGGFISVALAILMLQFHYQKYRTKWIPELILALGTITMLCLVYAILTVTLHTPGRPPMMADIIGEILLITGYFLNKNRQKKQD